MTGGVLVTGAFDRIGALDVRFLEGAAALGPLRVALWEDAGVTEASGEPPTYTLAERRYLLESIRWVSEVTAIPGPPPPWMPPWPPDTPPRIWLDAARDETRARVAAKHGVDYRVADPAFQSSLPTVTPGADGSHPGAVVVTGCYDWLHSGHVRFFREAAGYGPLHVVLGHDANVRALKGDGHPLFGEQVRRYLVGSVRAVERAWIATGWGWLDAEPEIERIRPAVYLVNRDGDKPEKRAYCERRGIRYVVLERTPEPGLPRRSSTDLRGF